MNRKALFSITVLLFLQSSLFSQQHKLTNLWSSEPSLKVPESVLIDPSANILYVSNIDGNAAEKDGKGSIGKLSPDGKIIVVDWVSGLHAPKGMGMFANNLYVADVDAVVIIDAKKGIITKRVSIDSAVFLNDITIDKAGVVYVSDSRAGKVYRMQNGVVSFFLSKLKNPNGLLSHDNNLYLLDAGTMYKVAGDKSLVKIADGMEPDTDGIMHVKGQDFIVSCWGGSVYYINGDGRKEKLLDTRQQKINTADISYDPVKQVLYVPTFASNTVVAYKLQ